MSPGTWAIVEVMGHRRYAGTIEEVTLAGVPMLRVSVPAFEKRTIERDWRERHGRSCRVEREVVSRYGAFAVDLGGGALFAVTRCTEENARAALDHAHRGGTYEVVHGEWRDVDPVPQLVDAEIVTPAEPEPNPGVSVCTWCGWNTYNEAPETCPDCEQPGTLERRPSVFDDIRPLAGLSLDPAVLARLRELRKAHDIDDDGSCDIPF